MSNALFSYEKPFNDVSRDYAPGSMDRKLLKEAIEEISSNVAEIPLIIGGEEIRTGNTGSVVMPHDHKHRLAVYHKAGS
ncbi:MAG: 1-pyrroline-5-carboxylate dehydrogenase, partial [Synergistaceae bacterium]